MEMRKPTIGGTPGATVVNRCLPLLRLSASDPSNCLGHHNFNAIFDMDRHENLDLTVSNIRWTNPHVLIRGDTETGDSWTVETGPVNVSWRGRGSVQKRSWRAIR